VAADLSARAYELRENLLLYVRNHSYVRPVASIHCDDR
jgi:hypothetical protein